MADAIKTPTWKGSILSPILLLTLNLFVFGTMTVYFGNQGEFLVEDEAVLLVLLLPAVAFLLLLCAVSYPAYRKRATATATVLFFLAFVTYLHGNLLRWDTGILDGEALQTGRVMPMAVDALIWIALAVPVWRFRAWLARNGWKICVLLMVFQLVGAIETKRSAKVGNLKLQEVPGELYSFNDGPNVIHLILDGFQGNIFEHLVKDDPELVEQLRGFVFFRDAMTPSAVTYLSVPATLSGKAFDNSITIPGYHDETLGGENLFAYLSGHGFEVDVATPSWWNLQRDYFSSYYRVPAPFASLSETTRNTAWYLLDISLFRQLPYALKSLVYRRGAWLFSAELAQHPEQRFQHFAHNRFLVDLAENARSDRGNPTYKLIHVITPHAPLISNPDCSYAGHEKEVSFDAFADQSRCSLDIVAELLGRLRSLGIYDQSLIMIHGDHGGGVAFDMKAADGAASTSFEQLPGLWGNPLPLILVKPPGSTDAFRISDRPVSLVDLPATASEQLGLPGSFPGLSMFSDETPTHNRMFYTSTQHRNEAAEKGRFADFTSFEVSGSVFDAAAWKQVDHSELSESELSGEYAWGEPLTFGRIGSFKPFGDGGWTVTRGNEINWTQGRDTGLLLPVSMPDGDIRMTMTVRPLLVPGKLDRQRVGIMVNGGLVEELELTEARFSTHSVVIPRDSVRDGKLAVRFHLPDAAAPVSLGSGEDDRELALAFLKVQFDLEE